MKAETKELLAIAQEMCEDEDRSIEYMISFMMDSAGVNHDCVMAYLTKLGGFREVTR